MGRKIGWGALATAAALMLASCVEPPNTAHTEAEALQHVDLPLRQSTPIVAVMRSQGIQPLDPSRPQPLLRQLVDELRKADKEERWHGVTYRLSEHNALGPDWLVQTPNWWGRAGADLPSWPLDCPTCLPEIGLPVCTADSDCGNGSCRALKVVDAVASQAGKKVCVGHSDLVVEDIYQTIAAARYRVDITSLQPPPDGRYLAAIRRGLLEVARSGNAVVVRMLVGQYPPQETHTLNTLKAITAGLDEIKNARLSVHVGAMRSCSDLINCGTFAWNHAKIVSVDGRDAIVGGHNMWTRDYLLDRPVHDLSMHVRGPAASDASAFADELWNFTCLYDRDKQRAIEVLSYTPGQKEFGRRCPPPHLSLQLDRLRRPGNVPILAIGRMGAGISEDFANHSDLARDLMFGAARKSIHIVQQDFGFNFAVPQTMYPESSMERIADFLLKDQGDVFMVLSNYRANGKSGATYSNRVTLETTAAKFREVARRRSTLPDAELDTLLCKRMHLAPFRFGPEDTWPNKVPISNHSKFWMIDNHAFYIGSDNIYPVDLQEFGYIVDSAAAAADLRKNYFDPLWRWSSPHAVSGEGAKRCVLKEPRAAAGR